MWLMESVALLAGHPQPPTCARVSRETTAIFCKGAPDELLEQGALHSIVFHL